MIDALMAAHPRGMDRANLADRVGMTATSGTFQTYLSRLKSNSVIEVGRPQNHAHGDSLQGRCQSASVSYSAHPGQEQAPQIAIRYEPLLP
jgi:hypothetical protein